MAGPLELTDDTFQQEVLGAASLVVVDFSGEWCPHCRQLDPVIKELAEDYGETVKVCTLDINANRETPAKYSVLGIPTVIIFRNGEAVGTHTGYAPKETLKARIDAALSA